MLKKTYLDAALLVLRIGTMVPMCISHGFGKLKEIAGGNLGFADPVGMGPTFSKYLAVFGEFGCAFLVIIGFFTRWATLPLMLIMAVAFFVVHKSDNFSTKELAWLYFVALIAIFLAGPGKYSLDMGFKEDSENK